MTDHDCIRERCPVDAKVRSFYHGLTPDDRAAALRVVEENALDRSLAESTVERADGTVSRSRRHRLYRRLRLRRSDGGIYLDRWGIASDRFGGVLLHRMNAGDPGLDLHDHPFWFVTIPLCGGYVEQRSLVRDAVERAIEAEDGRSYGGVRGVVEVRRPFRPRVMRLDECHTITELLGRRSWSLVIRGPRVRRWGFYTPHGYLDERIYDATVRVDRRDLWNEIGT